MTFSYHSLIQKDPFQTSAEQTVSKSLQFQIRDVNSDSSGPPIPIPETPSPLQQFKSGIKAEDVKCAGGFTLVLKSEDSSPACVKPDTAQKLIERGWGTFTVLSTDYTYQKMNGTLSGNVVLAGGPQANYEVDVYVTDGTTIVGKTLSDVNGNYSIQLPAGNYTIYVPDYPTKQTHFVSVFSGKNTIFNIVYGTGYK
ncbi:hypothetical protein DYY67_1779 [Candidatus Nitrosotalea sp. TS]|uniref:carboxypeptidase-like regulatory domain-containing protein n=1 Tax=Candidatus Nitrosotalea sp. TS TaxID=2341020 RepID=UPI00140BF7CF|nr:carboxypeptidase-like regulatory domain-containing protein [Candidatus Nitrosotalea sp. TS]NHI04618.1 hypothetical protein [Candidatus Nitrosotalea sp. TS]